MSDEKKPEKVLFGKDAIASERLAECRCRGCGRPEAVEPLGKGPCPNCGHPRAPRIVLS